MVIIAKCKKKLNYFFDSLHILEFDLLTTLHIAKNYYFSAQLTSRDPLVKSSSSRSQTRWRHSNGGGHKNNFFNNGYERNKLFLFLTSKKKLFLWKNQKNE